MTDSARTLKKHANRRLYDPDKKEYLSLQAVRDLICDGIDVRVEDSKTGDDITRQILLQIMAECEQDGRPMLTPAMLLSLIRHYGSPTQEFVGPFLEKSLSFYARQEAKMRKRLSNLIPDADSAKPGREGLATIREALMQVLRSDKSSD